MIIFKQTFGVGLSSCVKLLFFLQFVVSEIFIFHALLSVYPSCVCLDSSYPLFHALFVNYFIENKYAQKYCCRLTFLSQFASLHFV